jgi:PASTA domain/Fibronectin type III domain
MADDVTEKAGSFLTKKVGPLPLAVWLVAGAGIYWYFARKQAGGSGSAAATASPGSQTDPAGNTGYIDPSTGYVYGSPEDTAALQSASQTAASSGTSQTASSQASFSDNNAWGRAAINYLVGVGIDPTTANQAIQLYLSSQPLTASQQGDVNLAIQTLGPPPSLPGPVTGNPPPVTTPPGGTPPPPSGGGTVSVPDVRGKTVQAANAAIRAAGLVPGAHSTSTGTVNGQTPGPGTKVAAGSVVDLSVAGAGSPGGGGGHSVGVPKGFMVAAKSGHSVRVNWQRVNGATGYHLSNTPLGGGATQHQDVGPSEGTAVFTNLKANGKYVIDLWAEPTGGGTGSGPHAEVSVQLPAK